MCSVRPPAIVSVSSPTVSRTNAGAHERSARASSRRRRSSTRPARRGRRGGRSACRASPSCCGLRVHQLRERRDSSGATDSASASAASFADWISAPLSRSRTVICSPGVEIDRRLADRGGARVDGDDVGELVVLERDEHRHQLRDRRDRQPLVRVRRGEHLAGARVLDRRRRCALHRRRPPARARAPRRAARPRRGSEQPSHLIRICSPMKSDVERHVRVQPLDRARPARRSSAR